MNRTVWKWLLGISIALLILLLLFTFGIWVLFNIGGAILLSLMGNTEIHAIPFSTLMSNFVGSPLFYIFLFDCAVLLTASIVLIMTRSKNIQRDGKPVPYDEERNYELRI